MKIMRIPWLSWLWKDAPISSRSPVRSASDMDKSARSMVLLMVTVSSKSIEAKSLYSKMIYPTDRVAAPSIIRRCSFLSLIIIKRIKRAYRHSMKKPKYEK